MTEGDLEQGVVIAPDRDRERASDPRERLAGATAMPAPLARDSALSPRNRTVLEDEAIYHVIRYTVPAAGFGPQKTPIVVHQVTGTHLYVHDICGGFPIFVRLGADSNPWIRLRPGLTLTRRFNKVSLFTWMAGTNTAEIGGTEATLYVSTGELFSDAPPIEGLCGGTWADNRGVATPAGVTLFGGIGAPEVAGQMPTTGKIGGVLVLTNTDLSNTLLVKFGLQYGAGYPLLPGQSLTVTLTEKLYNTISGAFFPSLACAAGTCAYSFILSPYEVDPIDLANFAASQVVA